MLRIRAQQKEKIVQIIVFISVFAVIVLPLFVHAQSQGDSDLLLRRFLARLGSVLDALVGIVSGIALLGFVAGIARFIFNSGDEEKRKDGKKMMLWSIFAIFIMVSLWGIVGLLQSAFSYDELGDRQNAPCLDSGFFGGQEGCN